MSQTVDIGAARIHLVVDATDYEPTLNRLKNTAADFGNAAEQAFERSSGKARTAANRLLDYVATLGRAESQLERMVRQASRAGVEAPIIAAAVTEWKKYQAQLQAVETQQRQVNAAFDEAAKINTAFDTERSNRSQFDINRQLGVVERDAAAQAQRRADAEAAILPLLQRQEREYEQMLALAHQINSARDQQIADNAQTDINRLVAPGLTPKSAFDVSEQRRIVELFNQQAIAEQAVEAEARDIHAQWVAIERQIQSVGKSTYDIMRANAQQRFGANAAPLIDQINKWEKLNTTISGTTVNTKQLQQAIRFLPAQFTDIGVSLAGGMNPLLVAFQQGGQIFDQFRLAGAGAGDTLRMLGSYAMKLINPYTVATATLAAFAYAGYDAAKSMEELAIASAKGFGAAGDATQLYALSESLNKLENVRLGPAEQAVARLAASGRLAGENFDMAAEATARWSTLTGEAADRVAGQFEAIAKDPLQAIESGIVRVTQAQYEQIRALVNQGREQDAVNTLTKIWYDTVNASSGQVETHLSGVSRYLGAIKDNFSELTRAAGGYFNSVLGWMADYEATYQRMVAEGSNPFVAQVAAFNTDPKKTAPKVGAWSPQLLDVAGDQRQRRQATELAEFLATADEKAQRAITITRIRENGIRLGVDELTTNQIITRQEKAWAAADAKKNKRTSGGTGARTAARDVRYDYQLESALLQTQTREVQAAYAAKEISAKSYYDSLLKFAQQEFDIQKRSNAEQLAAVAGKKGQEHEVARLRVADAIAEQQLAQRTIEIKSQEAQYLKQIEQDRRNYTRSIQDSVQAQQEEFDVAIQRATMGDKEFERFNAQAELRREEARLLREIRRQVEDKAITAEEGALREQVAIQGTNDKLAQQVAMYARLDAVQADWSVGAERAWKNWQDDVEDVSGHAERFFTEALDTFTDLTTDALTGNLKSWGDYFDGLARMITQFIVKQQLTKWIESINQSQGGSGGWWDKAAQFVGGLLGGYSGGGGASAASTGTGSYVSWIGKGYAAGGQMPRYSAAEVNERGFEMATVGSKSYLLTGSRPVQITPNHRLPVAASAGKSVTIIQNNTFDMASDRTTRDQYLRGQAKATNKALSKV